MTWEGSFLKHNGRTLGEVCQLSADEWTGKLQGKPHRIFRTRAAARRAVTIAAARQPLNPDIREASR